MQECSELTLFVSQGTVRSTAAATTSTTLPGGPRSPPSSGFCFLCTTTVSSLCRPTQAFGYSFKRLWFQLTILQPFNFKIKKINIYPLVIRMLRTIELRMEVWSVKVSIRVSSTKLLSSGWRKGYLHHFVFARQSHKLALKVILFQRKLLTNSWNCSHMANCKYSAHSPLSHAWHSRHTNTFSFQVSMRPSLTPSTATSSPPPVSFRPTSTGMKASTTTPSPSCPWLGARPSTTTWPSPLRPNVSPNAALITKRKKRSHFDLKSWVTGGTKIRPEIPSNWRIFESISSQFDSNILQWLEISGWILVPLVTQLLGQNYSIFSFSELFGKLFDSFFRTKFSSLVSSSKGHRSFQ